MSELKPCPFCGGEAELVESEVGCQVYCSECDCGTVSDDWVRCAAVEMWNNRTNRELAAAKAEIEKLSPLVEIVSNQKQRIQQMEEQLAVRNEIDNDFYQELEGMENLTRYGIYKATIKHKDSK